MADPTILVCLAETLHFDMCKHGEEQEKAQLVCLAETLSFDTPQPLPGFVTTSGCGISQQYNSPSP